MGKTVGEILDMAIRREEVAYDFYMDIHEKVEDASVRETVEFVAREEKKHREKMEYLYANTAFPQTSGG
ncbi:MAG: hypothetical protein GY850_16410 [bacterium]|nr:hypothetical protein [bacterium]